MERIKRNHAQKIRYMLVGGFNTALDFALLFIFVGFGLHRIPANYLSTGISMVFSFFANKNYTFKNTGGKKRQQFALFVTVTIIGMWVIQPAVILLATSVLDPYVANKSIELFLAKTIATGASLVWNYLLYSRVVFKMNHPKDAEKNEKSEKET